MKNERFEDIEAWQLARELTRKVSRLTKKPGFEKGHSLKRQIQDAAGSSIILRNMNSIRETTLNLEPRRHLC
ncbi:four helix bundle protein [Thermodesulfovibrionales bacterium]|nr:four helix bundle protein [Thermodesulfovibrionales bacterium]